MTRELRRAAATASERGFVIIAVLWILAALAALATIFSVYLSNSAQALAVNDSGLKAEALVSASLELTTYQLLLAGDKARPARGSFHFRLDNADVLVSFTSEAARIDLNFASKEMLANLFAVLGADPQAAKEYADRTIGWRTRPKPDRANDEQALYGAAGLGYSPRQSLFTHVNELSLVLGLLPVLVDRALPFVTVFNGSSNVDVLIAPPEIIAALPGMTPSALKDFLSQRSALSRDSPAIATALGPAQANATVPKNAAFRILTTIQFDNGRRMSSEVVIALGGEKDPYRVLSWQDDVETGRRSRQPANG
ncbi:MAG TPA: type II secretion system minor pseudopilin GspK [Bradyrhizobium sp.]|nr:type II secretion system minor pseudopilin GspK [Bradyrhizobium sp.]